MNLKADNDPMATGDTTASAPQPNAQTVSPQADGLIFIKPIGKGGFGEVWLAQDIGGRRCAVKILRADVSEIELNAYRVYHNLADARADGLIQIYTLGHTKEGRTYCSMLLADDVRPTNHEPKLYEPRTLANEISRRSPPNRLTPGEAMDVTRSVLCGLQSLHEKGLVHCDVKPANILCVQGRWLLGDTGLLRRIEDLPFEGGTDKYRPPEGIRDRTGDLYAVGKSLYQMVTGELDSFPAPLYAKSLGTDPTLKHQFRLINNVVLKACAPESSNRYQSAVEILADIDPPARRRLPFGLIAVGLILVIGLAFGYSLISSPSQPASSAETLAIELLAIDAYRKTGEALGAIGQSVDVLHVGDAVKISVRLSSPAFCYLIAFNPDGKDQLCWPARADGNEDRSAVPVRTSTIDFMKDTNWYFHLTDGTGTQVFVVIASKQPLPAYATWKAQHADIRWQPVKADGAWEYNDGAFHPLRPTRGPIRPLDRPHPVKALCDQLKQAFANGHVRATAFAVIPSG